MKICTALQFKTNSKGQKILQAKWQPIQFSGTYQMQLSGEESDWQDVDLVNEILPVELDAIAGEITSDLSSQEKGK